MRQSNFSLCMETSQEVNTTVEKDEETQDVENEQNEDETVLDSSPDF